MQRRATWILAIASAVVLAAVLLVPGTASANHGPLGRTGMIQLNWTSNWRAGAAGHTRRYLTWTYGVGRLGVPDNKAMRITNPGWGWYSYPSSRWGAGRNWTASGGRRVWIVDNNWPAPQDRWHVSWRHFKPFRMDVTPVLPPPGTTKTPLPEKPKKPPEKPKKPPVVVNQETITNFLNQNADPDTAKKVQGVLDALNGHNAPPPSRTGAPTFPPNLKAVLGPKPITPR